VAIAKIGDGLENCLCGRPV